MDFPVRFTESVFFMFFNVWNPNGIQLKVSLALNWKELCCEIFNVRFLGVFLGKFLHLLSIIVAFFFCI